MVHVDTEHGQVELSIFEAPARPHFRLSAGFADSALVVTVRHDGSSQGFDLVRRGAYWVSQEEIPAPHQFGVTLVLGVGRRADSYRTRFV
jgi:hypothetical protein